MVSLKLREGKAYEDLWDIFDKQLDENGCIKLSGNHIKLNGCNYYWKTNFPCEVEHEEEAVIELYPNSFELLIDGERRVIMNPVNIKQLWITSKGRLGSDFFINWGEHNFKL